MAFHLCQEHYWFKPVQTPHARRMGECPPRARQRRCEHRLVALENTLPKANNKRVLQPYSKSMEHLLKNGYKAKLRPSGHDISDKFNKDNGGSVRQTFWQSPTPSPTGATKITAAPRTSPSTPPAFPLSFPNISSASLPIPATW